jgi:hypothetical protein
MKSVLILAAGLLLVVVATIFEEHNAKVENVAAAKAANAIPPGDILTSLGQSDEAGPEVKLVLLALLPDGFENTELRLDAGEYLFIIANRTGLKEVDVRVERAGRERLARAVVGKRRKDWKQRFVLTPGTYLVTANDNPDWTCRIVVGR